MKYIRKDNYLINIEKCVHIRVAERTTDRLGIYNYALVIQSENSCKNFLYETKESVYKDMERIEEFIGSGERLLIL